MTMITISKKEYDLLKDFYTKAKKQAARARLVKSVEESNAGKTKFHSPSGFNKKFGI